MTLLSVVIGKSFIEKALLLVLAAAISGFLLPLIFKYIDHQRSERISLKQAKMELHSDVAETVLRSMTLALDISYLGSKKTKDEEMQAMAYARYNERIADLMADWRVAFSKSQTLTTSELSDELQSLQAVFFGGIDTPVMKSWSNCKHDCEWDRIHAESLRYLAEANSFIKKLAIDLELSDPDLFTTVR